MKKFFAMIFMMILLAACTRVHKNNLESQILIKNEIITKEINKTNQQEGLASFYANMFNGRKTANGEIFSNNKYTAASLTLPFGKYVRVTHLANNKKIIVKINDIGPYIKNRIIDLSKSAAQYLGMLKKGVANVKIELIDDKHKSKLKRASKKDLEKMALDDSLIEENNNIGL